MNGNRFWLLLLPLLLLPSARAGDLFGFGVRAGVPLTHAFNNVSSGDFIFESSTKRFTVGPSAEIFLPFGLGFEVDLLYKRTDVSVTEPVDDTLVTSKESLNVWEIPLLAKLRLPGKGFRPFVTGGGSYRSFGSFPTLVTDLKDSGWGFVLGGGLEFKFGRLRISPEIRYTRWGSGQSTEGQSVLEYNRNQADLLVGITF